MIKKGKLHVRVVIVGGGASAIELSFALDERWRKGFPEGATITILTKDYEILLQRAGNVRREFYKNLQKRGVNIVTKTTV